MRLGYPCINTSLPTGSIKTFRLKSYSSERLAATVEANLTGLTDILEFNLAHGLLFFRISSQIIPFASHPISRYPWQEWFRSRFNEIGRFIRAHGMRMSMHPDQFTVLNSLDEQVVEASIKELEYHAELLGLLGLDDSHKVQIHVGGVYGDKEKSMERFVARYEHLSDAVRKRLVIENDDRLFSLEDCLRIHEKTGLPIVLDVHHHRLLPSGGFDQRDAIRAASASWAPGDGPLIIDYSSQQPGKRLGTHIESIDLADFETFLQDSEGLDFDLMLEIKDKEHSALKALQALRSAARL
jgi:UV damage endonuclease UvdE